MNRWIHLSYILAIIIASFVAFLIGSWRSRYLRARFDLVASVSTEAKLRASKADSMRNDNEVRLRAAYLTLSSMPSWMSVFQPGTQPRTPGRREEMTSVIHDVLLERFGEDIPAPEIASVLQKHLNKSEVFRVSVRE